MFLSLILEIKLKHISKIDMDRYFFNRVFKEERIKRNMNQVAFGKKLGVMRQSISLLERHKCIPPLRMVIRFCRVFDYKVEMLPNNSTFLEQVPFL